MKIFGLIITVLVVLFFGAYYLSVDHLEIKIKNMEITTSGNNNSTTSKYLVFTENEVFENTDSWTFLKFNSSDIQNKFELKKTYKVKVAGWRIPFLSMYRNIIEVEK